MKHLEPATNPKWAQRTVVSVLVLLWVQDLRGGGGWADGQAAGLTNPRAADANHGHGRGFGQSQTSWKAAAASQQGAVWCWCCALIPTAQSGACSKREAAVQGALTMLWHALGVSLIPS